MGCECNNGVTSTRICSITVSLFFLLVLASTQLRSMAEGRSISNKVQTVSKDQKELLRGQIGSRPPKCERRCSWCEHCEAIQVPANPQVKSGTTNSSVFIANYERDERSNYKPMSWKCKCGSLIYNP